MNSSWKCFVIIPGTRSHLTLIEARHLPLYSLYSQSPHQLPLLPLYGAAQLLLVVHDPVLAPHHSDVAHRPQPLQPDPGQLSPLGQTRVNSEDKVEIELLVSLSN